jgi:hypothetical protein
LDNFDDFKESEVKRIIAAYLENNQVLWILGDSDVKDFAQKIVAAAKTPEAAEVAATLKRHLDELEGEDDDLPF